MLDDPVEAAMGFLLICFSLFVLSGTTIMILTALGVIDGL
jgi:hypothetical protein